MSNCHSILDAYLSQQNTITLFWDKDDQWNVVKSTESYIKTDFYAKRGLFGLYSLLADRDKTRFRKFVNYIKNRKLSRESNPTGSVIESIFMFDVLPKIETYYKISCYESANNEMLIKIERLSTEYSYRYDTVPVFTNDKVNISVNREIGKLLARHPEFNYAVIQFDIENFKMLNSQYGEEYGDNLLKFIINSLKYICNDNQLYARITSDIFIVVTPYVNRRSLITFVNTIKNTISNYNNVYYRTVFGINLIADTSGKVRKHIDDAAIARKSIKKDALKYYAFYDESMNEGTEEAAWVQMNMESALKNKEFKMYLQPKYSISQNTIVGAEALVRWVHPTKGVIPPINFISIFESNGFIKKLDQYMWEEACKCLHNWIETGVSVIPISVNVSRKHLDSSDYIEKLEKLMTKYKLDRSYLELEITETLNEPDVQSKLEILKNYNYTLLMDDFGSGYSSLNTLKDAVFDTVKIDREFLTNFISSHKGKCIVEHTINMTRDIGMSIIAEGVETVEQAKFLESCGCDVVQGFLYAKPMPLEEFNSLRQL